MGYFNASVDTTMEVKKRKLSLTFNITAREPYILSKYTVRLNQQELARVARSKDCLVKENERFDANILDEERARICGGLMDAITGIAVSLPEHTVVPYPNVSKRYYPKNIPLEVLTHEEKTG